MSKLSALIKTLPRLTPTVMAKGASYKTSTKGARSDAPFDQAKPVLATPYEFPVTTFAAMPGEVEV